ncbi:hypothetical protein [Mamestra configurata nucleopolyhedrovirus A]|uniref:Ac81 n=1 Tax=Mamestra configurata nucleopolyhedrovirus TaxID=207830 RepID=Q71AA9_NPVMC|nr:hypothetical protein [Mamestra configurata nucleopolyhedrovirus A]
MPTANTLTPPMYQNPTDPAAAHLPPTRTTTTQTPTNCLNRSQLNDKNLTNLTRVKYDENLLIHYIFDGLTNSENTNVIKVCKVRVRKTCGTLLAHYYAQVDVSNGFSFEFHPGSQPRTFQNVHTDGNTIIIMMMCDNCCKEELRTFVKGENSFNVAFKNCESILCKRKSLQTVLITAALVAIFANMFRFSWYYIFFVVIMLILLYINNNYMISVPQIVFCPHKQTHSQHGTFTRKYQC